MIIAMFGTFILYYMHIFKCYNTKYIVLYFKSIKYINELKFLAKWFELSVHIKSPNML